MCTLSSLPTIFMLDMVGDQQKGVQKRLTGRQGKFYCVGKRRQKDLRVVMVLAFLFVRD